MASSSEDPSADVTGAATTATRTDLLVASTASTAEDSARLPVVGGDSSATQNTSTADPSSTASEPSSTVQPASNTPSGPSTSSPLAPFNLTVDPKQPKPSHPSNQMTRKASEALGPAIDGQIPTSATPSTEPTLHINLLLTTGARHPYKINEKYLHSRKVEPRNAAGIFDPREISGYQLKELIWTDWREEWEPRPTSPSSIRLIILGRMIENKTPLKDFPFNPDMPNVVHMTVKPADLIEDEDTAGKGSASKSGVIRTRDSGEEGAGCRCVIL